MKSFKYVIATSEADACQLLGENAAALAGGTNLLSLMKEYVVQPDVVVDLKKIASLAGIEALEGGGLSIGAGVTLSELAALPRIAAEYPALHQAILGIGSPQLRNRGTVGGDLCVRPACWYFSHQGFDCAKKGGEGCPAKDGDNEFMAIFHTGGPCVMVHASSIAPALIAYGASVRVAGAGGARELPLEDFFTLPASDVRRENVLKAGEIVTRVILPKGNPRSATYIARQKATNDWPLATASVSLDVAGGICRSARIVLGAVAPAPLRSQAAEAALAGKALGPDTAAAAAQAAVQAARPLSGNKYKVAVLKAAVSRAILQVV